MTRTQLCLYALFCIFSGVLFPSFSRGQTASVGGVIRDPSEAVVSHAKITLQNTQTSVSREAATNDKGFFGLPLFPLAHRP